MKEWCMMHPWMTFIILAILANSIGNWFHNDKKD
jgi:hypothetical protein